MFTQSVNKVCKQIVENDGMHETARRLYEAAAVLSKGKFTQQGEVATFFGVSPQRLKNWESRGVSKDGVVSICEAHPISSPWLSKGNGHMLADPSHPGAPLWMTRRVGWVLHLFSHVEESDEYDSDDGALFTEVSKRTGLPPPRLKMLRIDGATPTDAEVKAFESGFKLPPGTIDGRDHPDADQSRNANRPEVTLAQALQVLVTSIKALPQPARKALSEDFALLAVAPGDAETMQRVLSVMTNAPAAAPEAKSEPNSAATGIAAKVASMKLTAESADVFKQGLTQDAHRNI